MDVFRGGSRGVTPDIERERESVAAKVGGGAAGIANGAVGAAAELGTLTTAPLATEVTVVL